MKTLMMLCIVGCVGSAVLVAVNDLLALIPLQGFLTDAGITRHQRWQRRLEIGAYVFGALALAAMIAKGV